MATRILFVFKWANPGLFFVYFRPFLETQSRMVKSDLKTKVIEVAVIAYQSVKTTKKANIAN